MLKFRENMAPEKERKPWGCGWGWGVQAAGVSREGCCAGTWAESKALVAIAMVGKRRKC